MRQVKSNVAVDLNNQSQQLMSKSTILGDLTNVHKTVLKDARTQRMSILREKRKSNEAASSQGVVQSEENAESYVSPTQQHAVNLPKTTSFTNLLQSMGTQSTLFQGSPHFMESNKALNELPYSSFEVDISGISMRPFHYF